MADSNGNGEVLVQVREVLRMGLCVAALGAAAISGSLVTGASVAHAAGSGVEDGTQMCVGGTWQIRNYREVPTQPCSVAPVPVPVETGQTSSTVFQGFSLPWRTVSADPFNAAEHNNASGLEARGNASTAQPTGNGLPSFGDPDLLPLLHGKTSGGAGGFGPMEAGRPQIAGAPAGAQSTTLTKTGAVITNISCDGTSTIGVDVDMKGRGVIQGSVSCTGLGNWISCTARATVFADDDCSNQGPAGAGRLQCDAEDLGVGKTPTSFTVTCWAK